MKYTDLAQEAYEYIKNEELSGVNVKSYTNNGIKVESISIVDDEIAKKLGKLKGEYISVTCNHSSNRDKNRHFEISNELSVNIKKLIPRNNELTLVAGLGNRNMTPDALGPCTVDKIMVTKHIIDMYPDMISKKLSKVCAFAPSVLGVTGVESSDVINAICEKIKPTCVIAVDSLAAENADRINDTVQISNTGISPGAGVGNRRKGINMDSVGVPVIAIGIPVVVRLSELTQNEHTSDMIVTSKNIDVIINDCSTIIANGINLALHQNITNDEIISFMY